MFNKLLVLFLMLSLTACANIQRPSKLQTGISMESDVIAAMGKPTRIWENTDGTRTYEYASQPYGDTCYMATLSPEGRMLKIEQTLSSVGQDRISRGMNYEQVERVLGRPRTVQNFALSGEEVWDWTTSAIPGQGKRFNVHFKQGVVVRTSVSMVYEDEDCTGLLCM